MWQEVLIVIIGIVVVIYTIIKISLFFKRTLINKDTSACCSCKIKNSCNKTL